MFLSAQVRFNEDISLNNLLPANTTGSEFSPIFFSDGLLYVSSQQLNNATDSTANDPLYKVLYLNNTSLEKEVYSSDIESFLHEGPVCQTNNNTLYVTRNAHEKNLEKYRSGQRKIKLQLFEKDLSSGALESLPFNSKRYSNCHPTFWNQRKLLFFASDRPGGYGGMDIYVAKKSGDQYSEVYNLGPQINSSANELFPSITESGILFYSSDRKGESGLDIYLSEYNNNKWSIAALVSGEFKSNGDDFGIILNDEMTEGYFSSSREGGLGSDDIYQFRSNNGSPIFQRVLEEEGSITEDEIADKTLPIEETEIVEEIIEAEEEKEVVEKIVEAEIKEETPDEEEVMQVTQEESQIETSSSPEKDMVENEVIEKEMNRPGREQTSSDIAVLTRAEKKELRRKKRLERKINSTKESSVATTETTTQVQPEESFATNSSEVFKRSITVVDQKTGIPMPKVRVYLLELDPQTSFLDQELFDTRFIPTESGDLLLKITRKPANNVRQTLYELTDPNGEFEVSSQGEKKYIAIYYKNGYEPLESVFSLGEMTDDIIVPLEEADCRVGEALVKNSVTGELIQGAKITISDKCKDLPTEFITDRDGYTAVCVNEYCRKEIFIDHPEYERYYFTIPEGEAWPISNVFKLRKREVLTIEKPVVSSAPRAVENRRFSEGSKIILEDIFYDFDRTEIQKGSTRELGTLADLMIQYDLLQVRLEAHTDSRGDGEYNRLLSIERANSAKKFLVSRGVLPSRIQIRGMGESQIRNQCSNGIPCKEADHQFNRRTEVTITKEDPRIDISNY